MAREITAGVLLRLKDQFSSQIKGAGVSVQGFADKAAGAAEKVNKAFSGVAGTLGTLGVSIGVIGAVKGVMDMDHRLARLGLTANADAREINALKRQIFETAQMPDIKLDTDSIVSALEVIMTKTGDLKFAEDNIRNVALAIQASGEAGAPMGDVFSEFAKAGYTAQEISQLLNDMVAQSDKGEFTFAEFAKNAKGVISAYREIGNSPEDIKRANAAMQILTAGTKSSEVATTVLNSAINELCDSAKREKIEALGIQVRNISTGKLRDFNDIMSELAAASEDMEKADIINTIFGSEAIKAIRAYGSEFAKILPELIELGDTSGKIEQKSSTMANTLKSNFQNLRTAFESFADTNLAGPLQNLADLLNKLAEDPEKIEDAIRNITITLGLLAGVKVGAGIISLVANLNSLKSGGGLNMSGLANAGGGAGIPVHVTNWGGFGGGPPGLSVPPTAGSAGLVDQYGRPLASTPGITPPPALSATMSGGQKVLEAGKNAFKSPKTMASGVFAAAVAAAYEIPEMLDELHDIDRDESLTDKERGKAKGGAIGDASGSIAGAAGGAVAGGVLAAMATSAITGTAIGTAIPGLGNIAGLIIGAGIGAAGWYFGGKAGRAIGGGIGEAAADNKAGLGYGIPSESATAPAGLGYGIPSKSVTAPAGFGYGIPASRLPPELTRTQINLVPQKVELEGQAVMDVNVNLRDERTSVEAAVRRNGIPNMRFNTGNAFDAREVSP